jgi:hypothetical protein
VKKKRKLFLLWKITKAKADRIFSQALKRKETVWDIGYQKKRETDWLGAGPGRGLSLPRCVWRGKGVLPTRT